MIYEILKIMAHQIIRAVVKDVSCSNWFALIAEEATDMALVEQVKCVYSVVSYIC